LCQDNTRFYVKGTNGCQKGYYDVKTKSKVSVKRCRTKYTGFSRFGPALAGLCEAGKWSAARGEVRVAARGEGRGGRCEPVVDGRCAAGAAEPGEGRAREVSRRAREALGGRPAGLVEHG
jgi:hypothetical protein